jgi:hypothetical protein
MTFAFVWSIDLTGCVPLLLSIYLTQLVYPASQQFNLTQLVFHPFKRPDQRATLPFFSHSSGGKVCYSY